MKENNKGFTMVELMAVITIIGILSAVAVAGVTQYLNKAKRQDFEILEKNMKTAVDNYFIDHGGEIPAIGGNKTLTAQTFVDEGYITKLEDPDRNGSNCDYENSYVTVTRAGNTTDFNMTLDYKICVICSKRKSTGC